MKSWADATEEEIGIDSLGPSESHESDAEEEADWEEVGGVQEGMEKLTTNVTCKIGHGKLVAASGIEQGAGYDKSEGEFVESAVSANGRTEDGGNRLYNLNRNTAEGDRQHARWQLQSELMISNTYNIVWNSRTHELEKRSKSYGAEEGSTVDSVQQN